MALKRLIYSLLVFLMLIAGPRESHAQDFQPPRPPPLDPATDFEDMEEDMMEMGDEGFRPPPPPPQGLQNNQPPPPPVDTATGSAFGGGKKLKKIFTIVEGEFWEKGKKRSRGTMKHISPSTGT